MVKQLPKRVVNHLRRRIEVGRHQWKMLQGSTAGFFNVRYYRSALFPKYQLPEVTLSSLGVTELSTKPLIMDKICMPPYYSFEDPQNPESHWANDHDDIRPLLALVSARKPQVIVELGTAHGNTTANLLQQDTQATLFTINAPAEEQTGEETTFDLTRDEVGCVYKQHGFAERVTQIYKNTLHLDLSEHFTTPVVDLAIVDACHDEDYVINDFLKVEPFIAPGGMVLLHDTHPSMKRHLIGSYGACMKLRAKGYDIKYLQDTWWGVWVKKIPEPSAG